ncbi:terpene cyclase/mutase family protein [Alteribacter natronophilus]|uniref:terpene cyclase/mutase family protein n=1 Tax=Alteribacter natronophilus TaxID=2583810 RepID=UPI00110E19EE|nr:prenyltransferase/squalene oxidase repeat-containing protein [Alteribacter natronophilus]TMW72862.1 squalene--hopene cyclase [Alteribacter natronophilus]
MHKQVKDTIARFTDALRERQSNDGSWRFCFETGPTTDAYTIILLRSLETNQDEWLIERLAERLKAIQDPAGYWKLYPDQEDGHLSATVEAYFALLYSGHADAGSPNMKKARAFIEKQGGLHKTGPFTRAMLALNGQIPWPRLFRLPIESLLIPRGAPVSIYDIVSYARVHIVAALTAANKNYHVKTSSTPDLSALGQRKEAPEHHETMRLFSSIAAEIQKLAETPKRMKTKAYRTAERMMLERIEPDGLYFSYITSTVLMIYALLALGYSKSDPVIQKALAAIRNQVCLTTRHAHIEFATSTVWDTSLLTHALQRSGVPEEDPMISGAVSYVLSRQHTLYGDWAFNSPDTLPGGWGFSDINTFLPDIDDTTAALRAVKRTVFSRPEFRESWTRGTAWVLGLQNSDGGWGAFEKDTVKRRITLLPFPAADRVLIDPSTADLTGRALEFLSSDANLLLPHPSVERAVDWLVKNQERDGSWYGRWGICYIYGAWAALTGLSAAGFGREEDAVKRGAEWLMGIQNEDGGWGESCTSDTAGRYVPLRASTPSQTAWAVDALIAVERRPTAAIDRGIRYLISHAGKENRYPTGAALPGDFYIYYHSYNYIWPLLALGNYWRKYGAG